jgi:hypothetical protein
MQQLFPEELSHPLVGKRVVVYDGSGNPTRHGIVERVRDSAVGPILKLGHVWHALGSVVVDLAPKE